MAYGNYFNGYQPYMQQPYQQVQYTQPATQVQQQQANNPIIWVQGEAGAKSYLVAAGQSVMLMDSEGSRFYIKSTDASGMPMPLRVFDYTERTQQQTNNIAVAATKAGEIDLSKYVTKDELKRQLDALTKGVAKNESAV